MLITEFRVVMPVTVEEYQVGQLFSVAEASMNETGGGEGVEVLNNEPYDDVPLLNGRFRKGQYTRKIYHLASKVPNIVRMIAPKGALEIKEEAWNAYPYCKTVLTNPGYMKDKFCIKVETYHLNDRGETENAHELTAEQLQRRNVVLVDIANDPLSHHSDYKKAEDPRLFKSKDGRGPLKGDWIKTVAPVMTAYKLVTAEFDWFGLQGKVEKYILQTERRLFTNFHRQVFCSLDRWISLNMEDIRRLEDQTKSDLDRQRQKGSVRGTKPV